MTDVSPYKLIIFHKWSGCVFLSETKGVLKMNITKQIMSALAVAVVAVVVGPSAHAIPMPMVWDAELTHFSIDEKLPFAKSIDGAKVKVDYGRKYVELMLHRRFSCPAGRLCAQVMPTAILIKLPIVASRLNDCGAREIIAKEDRRPADGGAWAIRLLNNTANKCPHFASLPSTQVFYKTESSSMGGKAVQTYSTFSGEPLRPVFDR